MRTLKEILISEATEHDYKLTLEEGKPISWLKSVSAFANGFGGSLSKPIQELDLNKVPSTRRNPTLADIFQRIDYAERRGSGLKKILNGYKGSDHRPTFFSNESSFRTTLYNLNYGVKHDGEVFYDADNDGVNDIKDGVNQAKDGVNDVKDGVNLVENSLSAVQARILELMRGSPDITAKTISEEIGINHRNAEKNISALKTMGLIERAGADKNGRWIVKNH